MYIYMFLFIYILIFTFIFIYIYILSIIIYMYFSIYISIYISLYIYICMYIMYIYIYPPTPAISRGSASEERQTVHGTATLFSGCQKTSPMHCYAVSSAMVFWCGGACVLEAWEINFRTHWQLWAAPPNPSLSLCFHVFWGVRVRGREKDAKIMRCFLEVDFGPFLNHCLTFFDDVLLRSGRKNIVLKYSVFVLLEIATW